MPADEHETSPLQSVGASSPSRVPVQRRYQRMEGFQVPPGFRGRSKAMVQLWWLVQATLFAMSPQVMYGWRAWLLRRFGARIGRGAIIRPSVKIPYPWKLTIGDHCHIGDEVQLYTYGEIEIGDCAVVSQRSYICAGSHDYTSPSFDIFAKKIVIGSEAWLATDVFVAPGVTIGPGAVVGARSSVFHDVPPASIAVGTPARVVGERKMRDGCDSARDDRG
jgi:putative colanic acid biosynthesis acetyltransferase WcaF